ncbi:NYN domain-containing protein [Streptomyces sp. 2333.5]|nr:NYN domain-containing protein [Streptomyces sp. 2333.5]SEE47306.1 NYN domain-containing protein [Streptomyces sp. 2314.4]SEE74229.1 NYN domain-containing protein [Streptomyces sp. 2112.2]SOE11338.1 NYN domain-containing protein [Streptomyces sp. 2323.1]
MARGMRLCPESERPENGTRMNDVQPTGPTDLATLAAGIERTNELLTRVLAEVATTPSTHAAFVDAGYVYAAAGRLVAGTEDRKAFDLDAEGMIEAFIDKARMIFPDSRLLRVYWYDGARRRIHTQEQQRIAELPDVKVRLGNLNANNQQKGVDSLIRSDLESLARHRAITDAVLIGGDEDLVSAVEAAQGYGARVHLWGIEASGGRNQAEPLLWEVDSARTFDLEFCKPYVTRRVGAEYCAPTAGEGPAPQREEVRFVGAQVAAQWLAERGREWVAELLPGHPYLPGAVDQELLTAAEGLLRHSLRSHADLRRVLRDGFWEHVQGQY